MQIYLKKIHTVFLKHLKKEEETIHRLFFLNSLICCLPKLLSVMYDAIVSNAGNGNFPRLNNTELKASDFGILHDFQ